MAVWSTSLTRGDPVRHLTWKTGQYILTNFRMLSWIDREFGRTRLIRTGVLVALEPPVDGWCLVLTGEARCGKSIAWC
jgi:hypothetical protein